MKDKSSNKGSGKPISINEGYQPRASKPSKSGGKPSAASAGEKSTKKPSPPPKE